MTRGSCTPEQRAACPLQNHFSDNHHLQYPEPLYLSKVEKRWRNQPLNKTQVCVAIHRAIHASGYVPPKPPRGEMIAENWSGEPTERSQTELSKQLAIGAETLANWAGPEEAA